MARKQSEMNTLPNFAVIIRSIHCRGEEQTLALQELRARGLWLSEEQKKQSES